MADGPLTGLTIVEIGHSISAPYAGLILAELGAEVVKVERRDGGDPARDWGPPYSDGAATPFQAINRSKRAVTIDFGNPKELSRLKSFIFGHADVVVQNLRAGAVARAGLGAKELLEQKPALIYANLHAFGAIGPLKNSPGYDALVQAFGGLMSITGESGDRPPVRVGVSIIDMGAALWTVIGIMAALLERNRTGRGTVIDTSLFETALAWMMLPIMAFQASGELPGPQGSAMPGIVPYQAFDTGFGYLMVAAGNDRLFRALCDAVGRPELAEDSRYQTNSARVRNHKPLIAVLQEIFQSRPASDWSERLTAAGVPNAPLHTVAEVVAHPQTLALRMIESIPAASLPFVGLPLSLNGARPRVRHPAPALGADNAELLGRFGEE